MNRPYINEDELPEDYPYDAMFRHSWLEPIGAGFGVRVFPVLDENGHAWTDEFGFSSCLRCACVMGGRKSKESCTAKMPRLDLREDLKETTPE